MHLSASVLLPLLASTPALGSTLEHREVNYKDIPLADIAKLRNYTANAKFPSCWPKYGESIRGGDKSCKDLAKHHEDVYTKVRKIKLENPEDPDQQARYEFVASFCEIYEPKKDESISSLVEECAAKQCEDGNDRETVQSIYETLFLSAKNECGKIVWGYKRLVEGGYVEDRDENGKEIIKYARKWPEGAWDSVQKLYSDPFHSGGISAAKVMGMGTWVLGAGAMGVAMFLY